VRVFSAYNATLDPMSLFFECTGIGLKVSRVVGMVLSPCTTSWTFHIVALSPPLFDVSFSSLSHKVVLNLIVVGPPARDTPPVFSPVLSFFCVTLAKPHAEHLTPSVLAFFFFFLIAQMLLLQNKFLGSLGQVFFSLREAVTCPFFYRADFDPTNCCCKLTEENNLFVVFLLLRAFNYDLPLWLPFLFLEPCLGSVCWGTMEGFRTPRFPLVARVLLTRALNLLPDWYDSCGDRSVSRWLLISG